MSIPLTIVGATFNYPVTFDENWGVEATGWAQAVTNGMLQRSGGNFPLTADANFGASFGLVSKYFTSRSTNPASAGTVRLASADAGVAFRNNANSGNLILTTDASDNLLYNGHIITPSSAGTVTSITGTANQVIASSATGSITLSLPQSIASASSPTFAGLTLSSPLSVANGGTGEASLTAYAVLCGGTTSTGAVQSIAAIGSAGQVLTSNGAGALPSFSNTTGSGTVNSGTAGNLTLYAGTGATVSDTYVQNSHNITIGIAVQASRSANLAVTVPNPGNAVTAASVVLTEGAQTINGALTLTASLGGILDLGSHKITSVTDPTSAQDAATKNYVDGLVPGVPTLATPTIVGVTAGNNECYYTLIGPKLLYVYGTFSAGSPTATTAVTAPPVGTVAKTKMNSGVPGAVILGTWTQIESGAFTTGIIWCDGSAANLKFSLASSGTAGGGFAAQNASALWTNGNFIAYSYTCPLV